jgi:hypothetical protein
MITHIWPINTTINPDAKPFSDEREDDVYAELRDLTLHDDTRGDIWVAPHDFVYDDWDAGTFYGSLCNGGDFTSDRVKTLAHRDVELTVHRAATEATCLRLTKVSEHGIKDDPAPEDWSPALPERDELIKKTIPWNLGSKIDARNVVKAYDKHEVCALILWYPDEDEHLTHIPMVIKECPDLPIYVFHCRHREDKFGVERPAGSGNWEDIFPALADMQHDRPEIIIDNMFIKGNLHVISAPPESFKTMGLIEISSAILEQRAAFDLNAVNARYPILYLCADMSPTQFDEYAAPFNLRRHGGDFRVMKGSDGIPNITDPALQNAVRDRILILDTMLDFAKIKKAFESGEWGTFMENLRDLMNVHGCVAIIMTAHTTRAEVKSTSDTINKGEYFKDSVTFQGKTDIAFGCKVLKDSSEVKWERIKGRGFKYGKYSFTVAVYDEDGYCNLDRGRFPVCTKPCDMKALAASRKNGDAGGRPEASARSAKIELARKTPGSLQEKADAVNAKYGSSHNRTIIGEWLKEGKFDFNPAIED